jgi:hypothetical protein
VVVAWVTDAALGADRTIGANFANGMQALAINPTTIIRIKTDGFLIGTPDIDRL